MANIPPRDQPPELVRQRLLGQLRFWQAVGVLAVVAGLWMVYDELGKDERWSALLGEFIGGPDPQAIMLGAVIVAAGVALVVWATRAIRRAADD